MLTFDYFAGGGGASCGIEAATGRSPDVAINHDEAAIAMHAINHPKTTHHRTDVWDVDPVRDLVGGPVGLLWLSPDCRHFSRAKGAVPISKRVRGLAWIALRLAAKRRPALIILENVPEFRTWGPLNRARNPLKPKAGHTFERFVSQLRALGYELEHRVLDAADYGAPTHRRRLFLIARCDGEPIVWPTPTHGPGRAPFRTAASCIDWSLPCPSIFGRKRPLAEATMRRIAEGVRRYVLTAARPFLVQYNGQSGAIGVDRPSNTITTKARFGLVAPTLVQTGYGERKGQRPRALDLHEPLGTVVACGAKHALVAAFLAKHYGGVVGHGVERPIGTVTSKDHHSLVACHLTKFYGTSTGAALDAPAPTVSAQGQHAALVAAFLERYVDGGASHLVTIDGETFVIVDIGLRMLTPRELARAQGFPDSYVLTGTRAQQVARVGNSVPPPLAEAVIRANVRREAQQHLFKAVG
jgi:DNA (cytosine-5)-methyltransferase 1